VAAIGCCVKWAGLIMQISRVGGAPGCQSSGSVSLFYSYSRGPLGGADIRFNSPKNTDTGIVHHVLSVFFQSVRPAPNYYTAW